MAPLPIQLIQVKLEDGPDGPRPFQWRIAIETPGQPVGRFLKAIATVFYVEGTPSRGYRLIIERDEPYRLGAYRGGIVIGHVAPTDMEQLEHALRAAALFGGSAAEASRTWAYAAMRRLYMKNFILELPSQDALKTMLDEALAAWECGDL
ncbi:hypothetical protein BD413DRAFT_495540 [Trametes elegans]|nr:hypothetical protein BD413DRAFT_495540 [Trametes elegans]